MSDFRMEQDAKISRFCAVQEQVIRQLEGYSASYPGSHSMAALMSHVAQGNCTPPAAPMVPQANIEPILSYVELPRVQEPPRVKEPPSVTLSSPGIGMNPLLEPDLRLTMDHLHYVKQKSADLSAFNDPTAYRHSVRELQPPP